MFAIITILALFLFYILYKEENKYLKWGVVLSLVVIATIFAFRNNLGADDLRYRHFFEIVATRNESMYWDLSGVEKTYVIISFILSTIGFNYKSVFVFYAIISFIFLYLIIKRVGLTKKETFMWILCFMVFCFVPYLTVMRQFAASMIALYAFIRINRKDYIAPLILFALAYIIHASAIVFVPLCLIKKWHSHNKYTLLVIAPLIGLILGIIPFWELIKSIADSFELGGYFTYISNAKGGLGGTGIVVVVMYLIYSFNLYIIKKQNIDYSTTPSVELMIKMSCVFFFLYFLTFRIGFLGRIYYPFLLFEGSSLITIYHNLSGKTKQKAFFYTICTLLTLAAIYNISRTNFSNYNFDNFSIDLISEEIK